MSNELLRRTGVDLDGLNEVLLTERPERPRRRL